MLFVHLVDQTGVRKKSPRKGLVLGLWFGGEVISRQVFSKKQLNTLSFHNFSPQLLIAALMF